MARDENQPRTSRRTFLQAMAALGVSGAALLRPGLSAFQRSYAFVLEHGLDVVNADMQSFAHFRENFVAAATAPEYFA